MIGKTIVLVACFSLVRKQYTKAPFESDWDSLEKKYFSYELNPWS